MAVLFELSVLYVVIDYLLKNVFKIANTITYQSMVSILFLILGYQAHVRGNEFYGFDKVFSYYSLYHIGIIMKHYGIYKAKQNIWRMCCYCFLAFVMLICCQRFGAIALDNNSYCNPVFLLVTSISGWYFIYEISAILECKHLNKVFVYLGNNTLPIVILHFLAFKIVNFAGVVLTNDSLYMVAAFPILYRQKLCWILYLIIGVLVPISVNHVYVLIINYFRKPLK